ncbi:MAG: hypothetical protein HYX48_04940 [Chlamydiales bacterium]|nr:hypothetical protein [Chlamydiales bacterium]
MNRLEIANTLRSLGYESVEQSIDIEHVADVVEVRLDGLGAPGEILSGDQLTLVGRKISTLDLGDHFYRLVLDLILDLVSHAGKTGIWAKRELAILGERGLRNFVSENAEHLDFHKPGDHDTKTGRVIRFQFVSNVREREVR